MSQDHITLRKVESHRDLRTFIDYPFKKYAEDGHWVPPLKRSEWQRFNPQENPFYEHARMDLYLAERGGEVSGRIAAIDDDLHNQTHDENLAWFGFFEAEDALVAKTLLDKVEDWAKDLGRNIVRGPANPSMNDGAGFQINAFETEPFIMMPQSPPEYPAFVEGAGYTKIKDLYAWYADINVKATERIMRMVQRVQKRYQPTIRTLDMSNFDRDVKQLLAFYNQNWEQNWGQTQYTDAEAKHLAKEIKQIVDPDLILFLELEGELAGVAVCFPDVNQLFKKMRGRLFPFGFIHALRANKIITRIRVPILGVTAEHRHKGLHLILISEIFRRGIANGYTEAECSWTLEDNDAINKGITIFGLDQYKTYRVYQKLL